MRTRPRVVAIVVILVGVLVATLVYSERVEPFAVVYRGVAVRRTTIDRSSRVPTIVYSRGATVYVGVGIENDSRLPITIDGVVTDELNASGYRLSAIRLGTLGQPGAGSSFRRTTIAPGEQAVFDLVYSATMRCDEFPEVGASPGGGFMGATYVGAELRFSVLGVVPRTEFLDAGNAFRVPQPSQADCSAS